MKTTLGSQSIPIKLWLDTLEDEALTQAKHLADLPFAFHHVAIMPDAHSGYGMPIGGVLATTNVIIPNAVGVDIGCGMSTVQTSLQVEDLPVDILKKTIGTIRSSIPLGFKHYKTPQNPKSMPKTKIGDHMPIVQKEYRRALTQVGTLGGGNHFIELQKDPNNSVWLMIHSGSRNVGHTVATYYDRLAIKLRSKFSKQYGVVDPKWQLDYLPVDSAEGQSYIDEMSYCVDFAYCNRQLMMDRILEIMHNEIPVPFKAGTDDLCQVNIAHNYASLEKHFGQEVWVHRKGATQAFKGQTGIIPGSQGSSSYIVRGLGNSDSYESCSHGAGRKMSRTQAVKSLDIDLERAKLEEKGVLHAIRGKQNLDEAPGAYKDIDEVMKNQYDLVEIVIKLDPIAVVKG